MKCNRSILFALLLCWTVQIEQPASVHDGDTFTVTIPVWVNTTILERVRVLNVDTPELQKTTMVEALQAKAFTEEWLNRGPFQVYTCGRDSFGRILGVVFRPDQVLADELKKAGLIKPGSKYNK